MDYLLPPTQQDNFPAYLGASAVSYSMLNVEFTLRPCGWLFLENKLNRVLRGTWGTSTKQCSSALKQPHKKESSHSTVRGSLRGSMFNKSTGIVYILKQLCNYPTTTFTEHLYTPTLAHTCHLYYVLKYSLSFCTAEAFLSLYTRLGSVHSFLSLNVILVTKYLTSL